MSEDVMKTVKEMLGGLGQSEVSYTSLHQVAIPKETSLRTCIYEHIYGLLQQPTISKEQVDFMQAIGHLADTLVGDEGQ